MAEPVTSSPICRFNVRLHPGVGAVECAQTRIGDFNPNPDSASIPEGVLVEFEVEEL